MTAAELATYIAAAKAAYLQVLATGAGSMSIAGRTTTWRDPDALLKHIHSLEVELAAVNAGGVRPVAVRFGKAV